MGLAVASEPSGSGTGACLPCGEPIGWRRRWARRWRRAHPCRCRCPWVS
ncbi:DUF2256 domain-containing protein [Vulcanococcus limneticus]